MNNKSIADFLKPTIITAQQYGTKVSVEIDRSDLDLDEVMDAFQTLITGMGYSTDSFKNWIIDRADEYRETDAEDLKKALNDWKNDDDNDGWTEEMEKRYWEEQVPEPFATEEELDAAFAQHNAHEEGYPTLDEMIEESYREYTSDNFEDYQHLTETGSTYLSVPVNYMLDDDGNKVYDFEGMADQFELQLSELDKNVVVMCSVETKEIPNENLIKAVKKYNKKRKAKSVKEHEAEFDLGGSE